MKTNIIEKLIPYYDDPVMFGTDFLGSTYTDYQQEILYAIADYNKVAWRSCHGVGKTYTASDAALWFLTTRYNSRVITTASLWRQVGLLWNEIRAKALKLKTNKILPIELSDNMYDIKLSSTWFAKGMASDDPQKLEGQHAEDILFIVDEAKLVEEATFKSISGALTSEGAKILVISTPSENCEGYFFDIWDKNLDYKKFHTSAFQSPNVIAKKVIVPALVTKEWVEEQKKDWGEESLTYITKVLGDFPDSDSTENQLIPYMWIEKAIDRKLEPDLPVELSCDVARFGNDTTVLYKRFGQVARIHKQLKKKDTMQVAGEIKFLLEEIKAQAAKIDVIGIGAGVCDRLKEQNVRVIECNNSEKPSKINESKFFNLRSEGYWNLRELFKQGLIDIENNKLLIEELRAIRYTMHSSGRIIIESKDEIKKRLGRSPDFADALMYLFLDKGVGSIKDFNILENEELKEVSNW